MAALASVNDVVIIAGKEYTAQERERIETLLTLVSDTLRVEAERVGRDLDAMVNNSPEYASLVRLVTTDIVIRSLRQSSDGEPMTQEAQSAMGYSWSGTYAIPGGGVSNAIMRNDLKRLGLRRQRYGVIEFMSGGDCDV